MKEIDLFITNYTEADKSKITFSWNGKEGDDWRDLNDEFRHQVAQRLLSNLIKGSDSLVRDLFLAEADICREAWGASDQLVDLGTLLLTQSLDKYVSDYFLGKSQSFDTDCALSPSDVSQETLKAILGNLKNQTKEKGDQDSKLDYYIEYFESYII